MLGRTAFFLLVELASDDSGVSSMRAEIVPAISYSARNELQATLADIAPRVIKWRKVRLRICCRRQFGKCGREIFPCEFAVAGQDRPEHGADHLANHEANRKRKTADHSNGAQRKPVSQPIQHAEKSAQI